MKTCKVLIQINKPTAYVFRFALNPKNTPLWIDSVVREEVNEIPTKTGTIYRNVNKEGIWSQYTVIQYEENKSFEFMASDRNYHVKYTFTPITDTQSELEYFEWVEKGELESPFTIQILEKLKSAVEKA